MNILILSSGTRNKVVQYFKKALADRGNVICTDMSNMAPSIYEADRFYTVPRMTAPGYIDVILDICRKEKIDGVLSLIDPELSLLAQNKEKFSAVGTTVIGSSYALPSVPRSSVLPTRCAKCPWINTRCTNGSMPTATAVPNLIWIKKRSMRM